MKSVFAALVAMAALLCASPVAFATGKEPKAPKQNHHNSTVDVDSSSAASAVAGARSSANARNRAEGGNVDIVDESRTVYEAERIPVSSAASAVEAYCGGGTAAAQSSSVGVTLSGTRDRVCAWYSYSEARLNLGDRYADVVTGVAALRGSLEELDLKGEKGRVAAIETITALASRVQHSQLKQYEEADAALDNAKRELELDDTFVRRAIVTVTGSLPLLNASPITPR